MKRLPAIGAGVSLLLLTAGIGGQQQPPAEPQPQQPSAQPARPMPPVTFKVEINSVEVDAVVTDGQGRFVRDLTKDDFEILEDRAAQKISTVSLIDLPIERVETPLVAAHAIEPDVQSNRRPLDGRVYVLLLDDQTLAPRLTDVMRETDAGYTSIGHESTVAREHFTNASKLLGTLTSDRRGAERSAVFAQRWYELVVNTYIAAGWNEEATQLIRHALSLYPRSARLYIARGTMMELAVALEWPDLRGSDANWTGTDYNPISGFGGVRRPNRNQLIQRLEPAAAEYRRALDVDPHMALARLHLGWVHLMERDDRARNDFVQALADATTPRDQYLAHLFLGALAERQRDWAEALQHYETARQIDPTYQTAYVAASHVQVMLGHDEAARELAQAAVTRGVSVQNPWWMYRFGGADEELLRWLHEEAERP